MVREERQRFRFPRSARLTRTSEFKRVKSGGKTFTGRYLVLAVFRSPDANSAARVGVVTSRRVGPAVVRNLVRRRLREVFRSHRGRVCSGWWLVVIARPSAPSAGVRQLEQEWLRLAERASILAPN